MSRSVITIAPKKFRADQLVFYIFLLPLIAYMLLPLLYIVFHAFKPVDELFQFPPAFITLRPTFDNFRRLFATANASNYPASLYVLNSAAVTLITVVSTVLISLSSAFVLSKKQFRGKKVIMTVNEIGLMFVPVAVAIPRFLIIKNLGLMNNYLAHFLPVLAMPVGLFLLKQFMDQLPDSLIEAARIDGCTDYGILFRIVFPLMKPALATVAILAFQSSWNSVEASQMFMETEKLKTFAYYMTTVTSPTATAVTAQGISAAAVLIMFIPNVLLFVFMQSKVMNTVAHSGIK